MGSQRLLRLEKEKELTSSFTTNDCLVVFCQDVQMLETFWILSEQSALFEQFCLVLQTLLGDEGLDLF